MDKAEIRKILEELISQGWFGKVTGRTEGKFFDDKEDVDKAVSQATSSLTALIIKWLESRKVKLINENNPMLTDNPFENSLRELRNQLITELIGELR
jgi:hypothetical protein